MSGENEEKKFEIPTAGTRPLTEKDFDNDPPAEPRDHVYGAEVKDWQKELIEKYGPKKEPESK